MLLNLVYFFKRSVNVRLVCARSPVSLRKPKHFSHRAWNSIASHWTLIIKKALTHENRNLHCSKHWKAKQSKDIAGMGFKAQDEAHYYFIELRHTCWRCCSHTLLATLWWGGEINATTFKYKEIILGPL